MAADVCEFLTLVSFPASVDLDFVALEAPSGAFFSDIAQKLRTTRAGVKWLPADQSVVGKCQKVLGDGESGVTPPNCSAWGWLFGHTPLLGARPRSRNYVFLFLQLEFGLRPYSVLRAKNADSCFINFQPFSLFLPSSHTVGASGCLVIFEARTLHIGLGAHETRITLLPIYCDSYLTFAMGYPLLKKGAFNRVLFHHMQLFSDCIEIQVRDKDCRCDSWSPSSVGTWFAFLISAHTLGPRPFMCQS